MRYGTVCSGVEAFGPAWEAMGYTCAFHAEIATHPAAVLRYHYPTVPNYGDFTTIEASDATRVDVLCGGTPCQDFSVAGLRKGLAGKRGNLTLEFAGLAQRLRPRWLVWENVPGVLSADGGRAFGQFLTLLAELGYYAAYRVLDAQHFGVPQRRRRVFLVAYLGDWRPAAAVLFEPESLRRDSAPSRAAGQKLAGTLTATTSGSGPASRLELAATGYLQAFGGNNTAGPIEVATCLTAHGGGSGRMDFESETFIAGTLCAGKKSAGSVTQQDAHAGLLVFDTKQITSKENRSRVEEGRPAPTLTKGMDAPAIAYQTERLHYGPAQQDRIHFPGGHMGTLAAGTHNNGGSYTKIFAASAVRRLTPVECERLMGYPANWTRWGTYRNGATKRIADGPRYQMCGNGWATPVANWVAERLMMVERLLNEPT